MIKNKKGQLQFLLIGLVIVFVFALVAIPMAFISDEISGELKKPQNLGTNNKTIENIEVVEGLVTPAFDQLIFFVLISIIIGGILIAVFTDFHPVVLVIMILAIIIFAIVAALLANVYDDFSSNPAISDKADEFTLTNVILGSQFPIIILIAGVISIIILFGKRGRATSPI